MNKWKVAGLVALGFVAGGVIGGLIGFAWHAPGGPKTWNDVRSWATFVVLVLGFSVAAFELNLQRVQFARQAARQEVTDDLLERQRREIIQTELARQRKQAERVTVEWVKAPGYGLTEARINNGSHRPITKIAAGIAIPLPDGGVETQGSDGWTLFDSLGQERHASRTQRDVLSVILAKEMGLCSFRHGGGQKDARLLVRFCDDAGQRWQLDNDMHLEAAPDSDW